MKRNALPRLLRQSAGTLLAVVFGGFQPAAENAKRLGFDLGKRKAAPEIGLDVNDFSFGEEVIFAGKNLHQDQSSLRKRVHHVQIAAVQAELADTGGDAHVGFLLDELGAGDESVAWRAALFFPQGVQPLETISHEIADKRPRRCGSVIT